MIIDPWGQHLKDKARKKASKAWRKKKGLIKPKTEKLKNKKPASRTKESNFYKSWEWKQLRYEVLRERGNKCECCGAGPNDGYGIRIIVDHIKPISKFPHLRLVKSNLQILCNDCNMGKSNIYTDDWRPETSMPLPLEQIREWLDE